MTEALQEQVNAFLAYVRERRAIQQRREAGQPPPWTDDPVLQTRKFCCVLRDDDRTSREAREVIEALPPAERLGVVLGFRLYNRVETLCRLLEIGLRNADVIFSDRSVPTINSNAYRVNTPKGLANLTEIARMVSACERQARDFVVSKNARYTTLAVKGMVRCSAFVAYQTMQDLRWLGHRYEDEMEWCYLGMGAYRGLKRLHGDYVATSHVERRFDYPKEQPDLRVEFQYLDLMRSLLPEFVSVCPEGNLFEVEHNLCEYDKLCRIRSGEAGGAKWNPKLTQAAGGTKQSPA